MSKPGRRRRKARTPIGKAVRAWPWVKRVVRSVRFLKRHGRAIRVALIAGVGANVALIVRKARRRRHAEPLPPPPPPPAPPRPGHAPPPGPGTREAGKEASSTTQTERALEAEKADEGLDVDAPNTGAPGGAVTPPEPPEPPPPDAA